MSSSTRVGQVLDDLDQLSPAHRGLTVVILVAPVLGWICSLPAGAGFSPWMLGAVTLLTVLTAIRPDSHAGLWTVLFLGWYWLTQVITRTGDPVSPWSLGAALCLLCFHSATAVRATAPGAAEFDQAFWRLWLSRIAIIAAATGGVWALTGLMASRHAGRDGPTLAAFAVLVGAMAYARWAVVRGR